MGDAVTGINKGDTLTGSAVTTVTLDQANTVTNLDAFSSSGGFTYNNAGALNITGAVSDACVLAAVGIRGRCVTGVQTCGLPRSGVTLTATGGTSDITLSGAVN